MNNQHSNTIRKRLTALESEQNIKVLLAVESGSRAWGFASANSDYDVRFIYIRNLDWYLDIAIEHKRDVIELPLDNDLDLVGWDARKALKLLKKSNPSILEWLSSPLVYCDRENTLEKLVQLADDYFSPARSFYHYISMATKNFRMHLLRDEITLKKYLYVLRSLLCARWVSEQNTQPPMLFEALLDRYLPSGQERDAIDLLLRLKQSAHEWTASTSNPTLNHYIENELARLKECTLSAAHDNNNDQQLNNSFIDFLRQHGETVCL